MKDMDTENMSCDTDKILEYPVSLSDVSVLWYLSIAYFSKADKSSLKNNTADSSNMSVFNRCIEFDHFNVKNSNCTLIR